MISGARKLPTQHISIRVPWHDGGWTGTVCRRPDLNASCRALRRIAESKDAVAEMGVAGESFESMEAGSWPPCVNERALFMAPFSITQQKTHPYVTWKKEIYGHFRRTPLTHRPYSAACIPFRWMLSENAAGLADEYGLDYVEEREPDFGKDDTEWIQERTNQLVMLDTFFSAVEPDRSLCFLYAKDTPLSTSGQRVIVGIGRVLSVGGPVDYLYDRPDHGGLECVLWERNIAHSIRPGFEDGFLFPYAELLKIAMERGEDPEQYAAFAPDDAFTAFSYASEHVSHDQAIASILSCIRALERIEKVHDAPWRAVRGWLDAELNRLWNLRGPFPGFGSALATFLGPGGNLAAYELAAKASARQPDGNVDPWPEFEQLMRASDLAEGAAQRVIGETHEKIWLQMTPERKALLKLLSRFSISTEQLARFFEPSMRADGVTDAALLENPYLLYELDRQSLDAISIETVDRGMLPSAVVMEAHPLPEESRLRDRVDPRRVRAIVVSLLEKATVEGHTLLPRDWVIERVGQMNLDTPCPVGVDVLNAVQELFAPVVAQVPMEAGALAYQLHRYVDAGKLIRRTVEKRVGPRSRRHALSLDWRAEVDGGLPPIEDEADRDAEERARTEKAAALEELVSSRLSVLIGAAGTGKTTLLKMLCRLDTVDAGGVLLLAPTGKARVQLEQKTDRVGDGRTIAQFLMRLGGRYDHESGRYRVTGSSERCSEYKTVIVDECSMLTEEQLAALLDGLSGYQRLVLVGDHRQLPPIGGGRPFVDIIKRLAPDDIDSMFPRVARGYAELTIPRRQQGASRADLALASWFGGDKSVAADEIWDRLESESLDEIRFVEWSSADEIRDLVLDVVVEELGLAGRDDETGFETALSGNEPFKDGRVHFRKSDVRCVEHWQIISPVRDREHGVDALNSLVQRSFRRTWFSEATLGTQRGRRRINPPRGRHQVIYGDKVINLRNSSRRWVYPRKDSYVANGDIGLVVGAYRRAPREGEKKQKLRKKLEVEFATQPGYKYDYPKKDFGDEAASQLELAYALTVHKTQGSEFKTTIVVIPNPCWLLSRELLYTALTRQQSRLVVLHQGDLRSLRLYSSESYSDLARRMTNLFSLPSPVAVERDGQTRFLEEHLIHRTKRGDLVRSKSEVIIANELLAQGFDRYAYEQKLRLPSGSVRYPDFTITDDDTGETFYWEHLGLLHNPEYRRRWERKLAAYRASGIAPHDEGGGPNGTLVVTRDDDAGGIDSQAIAALISEVMS